MLNKQNLSVNNVIIGSLYFDMDGTIEGKNETTGDTLEINFVKKTWKTKQAIEGHCKDK